MRAILIDPSTENPVREFDLSQPDDATAIASVLGYGCQYVEGVTLPSGDMLYIDEEARIRRDSPPVGFVLFQLGYPCLGRGLVLGCDSEGSSVPPRATVADVSGFIAGYTVEVV